MKAVNLPRTRIATDEDNNIVELGIELARAGNDVTVYASDEFLPEQGVGDSVKGLLVRYLPTRLTHVFPYNYFPVTPALYRELVVSNCDIVQAGEFFQMGTILSTLSASKKRIPCAVWHELGVRQRFPGDLVQNAYCKSFGRLIERKVSSFIPRSYSARDWLIREHVRREKIHSVIHTGVNRSVFFPLRNARLREVEVPEENVLVCAVARLHPYKGLDHLIRAMRLVVKKYPKISLIIRGDGPQATYLSKLVAASRLERHVSLIRRPLSRNELNELYGALSFTALPSQKELFPNFTVIESLACGKPVIHSTPGGERDLGGDGYASFYVRYGAVKALAGKCSFGREP